MLIIGWLVLSVVVGIAAKRRYNRDETGWALLAVFTSPLIAGLILLAVGPKPKATPKKFDFRKVDWTGTGALAQPSQAEIMGRQVASWRDKNVALIGITLVVMTVVAIVFVAVNVS